MIVPVAVQAGFDPCVYPENVTGVEGDVPFTMKWDYQNNFTFAEDVYPSFTVTYGGELNDEPTVDNPIYAPGFVAGDTYSLVPKKGHYTVTFQVNPPSPLDTESKKEYPPDSGSAVVKLELKFRQTGSGLGWTVWMPQGSYTYEYWDSLVIPEPATLVLLGIGAIGLRARRKQAA
jgi:hypothetical protein